MIVLSNKGVGYKLPHYIVGLIR